MYSYIVSEYSTRSPPQLHMQSTSSWCLQVTFLWSAMLALPTMLRNRSALVNAGWWLVGVKNLTRGRLADQRHGPYISWCSLQKHHNLPCFGSSNPSVAPSLGEFQYDMASKQPAVIEVPDDDFPNSGPQNPVEAQSYRDQLDAIMSTFSDLLADDCKDALRSTVTSLKKLMVKHWWQMAKADVDVVLKSIHNPSCVYLHQHLTTEGVIMAELVTDIPKGWTFLRQLPEKGMEDRGLGAHHDVLQPPLGSTCPHVIIHS